MIVYNLSTKYNTTLFTKNKKNQKNKKTKNMYKTPINFLKKNQKNYIIVVPSNWHFTVIKNKTNKSRNLYIYNGIYFFNLVLPFMSYYLNIDANIPAICLKTRFFNNYYTTYFSLFTDVFESFNKPFFKKVKFKGKGYYIFKNKRQTITPQFGHSHRLYVYAYFVSVIFLTKTQIFVFGLLKSDVLKASHLIKNMKPINIFTGRGVRFSRQIIYKKTGKVSSYR